jgi:hypothetical protein
MGKNQHLRAAEEGTEGLVCRVFMVQVLDHSYAASDAPRHAARSKTDHHVHELRHNGGFCIHHGMFDAAVRCGDSQQHSHTLMIPSHP